MSNYSVPWDAVFEDVVRSYLVGMPAVRPMEPDLRLRANGLNSYNALGLLTEIENAYGLKIPRDLLTFDTFETPQQLWEVVEKAQQAESFCGAGDDPTPVR